MKSTVLIIDDEKDLRNLLSKTLELEGYVTVTASNGKEAVKILPVTEVSVILTDVKLPDCHGVDLVKSMKAISPSSEVICLTAYGNIKDGVSAIKAGAFDYLVKGDDNNKIIPLVGKADDKASLNFKLEKHTKALKEKHGFGKIIGKSAKIREVLSLAQKVAQTDATVLLTGPTGTGKEVFAQAIHYEGLRGQQLFTAVNCSTFGKELLESELFGHREGAFTGATKNKKGLLEEANGGTLFLDEVGEIPLDLQAKLLRFLELGTFIKIGDTRETKVDVRIIAATNKDLQMECEKGSFREDLYYRLAVFQINLPSLNERIEDLPELADYFVAHFAAKLGRKTPAMSVDLVQALKVHGWKGNIRELRNVIERALILSDEDYLTLSLLPLEFNLRSFRDMGKGVFSLGQMERIHIERTLEYAGGNKTRASELLGIGLSTLYRKMEEYGIGK